MAKQNPAALTVENNLLGSTNFNMSCSRSTTMAVMLATPIYAKEILPGDKWRIKPKARIRTAVPFNTALMGSFSLQLAWFFEPDTNLYGFMDNNMQSSAQQFNNASLHYFTVGTPSDGGSVYQFTRNNGPGTLANYLYFPAGFRPQFYGDSTAAVSDKRFCAHRLYTYWDIMRNYYVNRQLEDVPVIQDSNAFPDEPTSPTGRYVFVNVRSLDRIFIRLRSFSVDSGGFGDDAAKISMPNNTAWSALWSAFTGSAFGSDSEDGGERLSSNAGLFCTNFRSDVYTRVMAEGSGFESTITISNNTTSYNQIIGASRFQAFINNWDITGGRFSDMMRFRYGVDVGSKTDRPYLLSVETVPLSVQDMRTTANTSGKAAASQVSFIDVGTRLNKISFNSSVSGTLMCIATIIPNVNYSEGIEREVMASKFMDLYQPEYANVSFENMPRPVFSALPDSRTFNHAANLDSSETTYEPLDPSSGVARNIAWWHYMTDVNRTYGHLSSGESAETWVINRSFRNYTVNGDVNDEWIENRRFLFTTYGRPNMVNYLFADTSADSQNFIVQLGLDMRNIRRPIPKFKLPYAY